MKIELNVDSDALVEYTNKLEKLHRSAFPNAVRGTLNGLAFDVKKTTMPQSAQRNFTIRQQNFFKVASKVKMARGFDVKNMESTVGFVPFGGSNTAVENLEDQERGGVIGSRSFIPTKFSRTSKSQKRTVARRNRIGKIKNVVNVSDAKGKSRGEKFIKSVVHAGKGGFVLDDENHVMFRVQRLTRAGRGWKFKLVPIYTFEDNRKVRIKKPTYFMRNAANKSGTKANSIYYKEANRQFKKHLQ